MVWPGVVHGDEKAHPLGKSRPIDKVVFHHELHQFYQQAIQMRRQEPCLNLGDFEFLKAGSEEPWIACLRTYQDEVIVGVFNAGLMEQDIRLETLGLSNTDQGWQKLFGETFQNDRVLLPAKSFVILKRKGTRK